MSLKLVVVDDTIVYRKIVSDVLATTPGVEVVGTANNGRIALSKIRSLKPDLITLDMEMPEMNGLEVLDTIRREQLDVGVIVLSSLTVKGGDLTMKALEMGAFDFVTKPEGGSLDGNTDLVRKTLVPMLTAFARRRDIQKILRGPAGKPGQAAVKTAAVPAYNADDAARRLNLAGRVKSEVVAIGISTGGPNALAAMLPKLPPDLGVPVLLVQHMPPAFTQSLARSLGAKCRLPVKEAENGELIRPNVVYIAPGGKQMKVTLGADATVKIIRITDDPPENNCRPSVDYLFRSVAHHYLGRATGVIMTGMGNDGTLGLRLMKRNGALAIAQDEASCVVYGMPKEVVESGLADVVAPLDSIADAILRTVR
jgi:two-component system chemotaxis response regulator CheB